MEVAGEADENLEDDGDDVDTVESEAQCLVIAADGRCGTNSCARAPLSWEYRSVVLVSNVSQQHTQIDCLS